MNRRIVLIVMNVHAHIQDILVDKEFEEVLKTVQEKMPLTVITGAAIRNSDIVYRDGKGISGMDPIKLLFEYMTREGLRIIDLFTSLDRDGSRSVSHKEFREGLLVSIRIHYILYYIFQWFQIM